MVALVPTSVADALHRLDSFPQEERWNDDRMILIKWICTRPSQEIFKDRNTLEAFTEVKLQRHEIEEFINTVEQTGNKEYAAYLLEALVTAVLDPVIPHGNATDLSKEQELRLRLLAGLPEEK